MTKKVWTTPQLIILARGTPEEAVLTHCKYIGDPIYKLGPSEERKDNCARGSEGITTDCGACQARSGS